MPACLPIYYWSRSNISAWRPFNNHKRFNIMKYMLMLVMMAVAMTACENDTKADQPMVKRSLESEAATPSNGVAHLVLRSRYDLAIVRADL
jgi:hypothetical protein